MLASEIPLLQTVDVQAGKTLPSYAFNRQMLGMLEAGFSWEHLPSDLRAAYCFGHYAGNVRNGGHSQFIGNSYNHYQGDPVRMIGWAMEAAERYGLYESLTVMRQATSWMEANPKETKTQTGFSPNVSPELRPFDAAFCQADLLTEGEWINKVKSLGEPHASTFLHQSSYEKGFVRFPAPVSEIEEIRLLKNRQPVEIINNDRWNTELIKLRNSDNSVVENLTNRLQSELRERLPKSASNAVLLLLMQSGEKNPTGVLPKIGPMGVNKKLRGFSGLYITIPKTGEGVPLLCEVVGKTVKLFNASGPLENPADMLQLPEPPDEIFARLKFLSNRRNRHFRSAVRKLRRQNKLCKGKLIGSCSLQTGQAITDLNRVFHIEKAIARDMVETDTAIINSWRLDHVSTGQIPRLEWTFGRTDETVFKLIASPEGIVIRESGSDKFRHYAAKDLAG